MEELNNSIDEVKIVVLNSGDQFIASVKFDGKVAIVLNPLRIIPTEQNKVKLFPWVFGADFSKPTIIPFHMIVSLVDPEKGLEQMYLQNTSIIQKPPSSIKTSLLQEGKK
jgi:hypothetical protein